MSSDLDNLEEKIKKARPSELSEEQKRNAENMSTGMRAGAELVGAIAGGAFIGWLLDGWLETKPLFLIIMLLLGIVTGFVNVYRISQNIGTSVGYSQLHQRQKNAKNAAEGEESNTD